MLVAALTGSAMCRARASHALRVVLVRDRGDERALLAISAIIPVVAVLAYDAPGRPARRPWLVPAVCSTHR